MAFATDATASSSTGAAVGRTAGAGGSDGAAPHWQSDGTIRLTGCPGGLREAATAATRSAATPSAVELVWTQPDTGEASETMSLVSGASAATCQVAWSPIRFTTGVWARLALWRLAIPLANPGPRCRSVRAGLAAMRP